MKDIFKILATFKNTFEDFRRWLFSKLNKDTNKFNAIHKAGNKFKLIYLIDYLEYKEVPFLSALCYYNVVFSNQASDYTDLVIHTIIEEFKRIENKKTINYVPF